MRTLLAIALLAMAGLAGCTSDSGTGSASIYVKDAPTDDFDEIHVVFTQVQVHATGDDGEDEDGGEWITVFENATGADVDLLNASGARAAFLGEADLEAGKYTQIRIDATEAYGMKDGERIEIMLSGAADLKVNKPFTIEADKETQIILDFDLDQSMNETPQGWRMTPVIGQTTTRIVEDDASGEDTHEEGEITEVE